MTTQNKELNEYTAAVLTLKKILKQRKITYRVLGEEIGLSESGIKKVLAAKDGSFQRLVEICNFIGISLTELLNDNRITNVSYSEKQQEAFLKEPTLFYLYWRIVYERYSLEDAKKSLSLNDKTTFKLLRKLDTLNLIKLLPGDRLKIPQIKAVRWKNDGQFVKEIYQVWSKQLAESLSQPDNNNEKFFMLRYLQLKESTYKEFVAAMTSLEEEFVRRSIYEMRVDPKNLKHVRWLMGADNSSFIDATQKTINS